MTIYAAHNDLQARLAAETAGDESFYVFQLNFNIIAFSDVSLLLGGRKGIRPVKN